MRAAQTVDAHCREIERCNQRGGRMLSIVDLIEAGTLAPDVAAYCIAAVSSGVSFLVGASPGGAGKTTIMGALLNFVPAHVALRPATEPLDPGPVAECWICHEIGPGPYYAYLWGEPLRRWFSLADRGAMLASNLHADTMGHVEHQVLGQCRVPREHLRRIGLAAFIEVTPTARGWARRIASVWESDGAEDHRCLWDHHGGWRARPALVTQGLTAEVRTWLDALLSSGPRTIHEVRTAFLRSGPA